MATNIKTVMTYPLDGSTTDFNIPFEYLARKFVRVTLIGVDRKELILNQDYRFAAKTTISTTRALGPADGYNLIEIRRHTSATERLVDFTDGSILRAYDLNISQVQTLHVAEEARDLTADTIGVNNDGNLDARGRRIVNVADGADDGDAISVGQVRRMNQNSWQARNETQGFRNEAQGFRNEAEGLRNQAATSKQAAAASESQSWNHSERSRTFAEASQGSANYAGQSATNASNSAGSAKTSENNSASSASASAASAVIARNEADRAKVEADKLGNMNDFAGTIKDVDVSAAHVSFKGSLETDSGITAHGESAVRAMQVSDYMIVGGDSWLHGVNVDGDLSARAINGSWIHSTGDLVADATLYVHGADYIYKDKWVPSGANKITNIIRSSVGGFACDEYFTEIVGYYIERGWHLVGGDNDTWMSIKGNGNFEISGNRGARIFINGRAMIEQDGNIRGDIWEGKWLRDYMNDRFLNDVWLGGQEWVATNGGARIDYALGGGSVCTGITQDISGGRQNAWIDGIFHRKLWLRYGNGYARIIGSA